MKCCKDIGTVSDMHIPHRKGKLMLRHQRLQNIPQIFSIIGQCIDVLRNTVMTPDQGFSIEIKTTVNKQRDRRKNNRIQNIKICFFLFPGFLLRKNSLHVYLSCI